MNNNAFVASLQYFRRDAMAGVITGAMAVPLTVGICLMSDYPVMTGLYTVIFAGIVSYISYLFKPGNYTGMPGVAAGLAPALALGVHVFGIENMPFVIVLTSTFQIIVWKFKLERYILRVVPHYLVEGLLAGVGLKIALKFVPFLYEINNETSTWLNFEREAIIVLSTVSFVLFVLLYKYYKKEMPALPYFVIMATSIGLSFFIPLPMISIEAVPFELALPLPHFTGMAQPEVLLTVIKMVGFAMMLGTIDVIEQVMSNVAIEKMDPLERECDTNNSLLAIWIANLGATFFGGMTNLDGLAKSTTNTVAGAMTKLSNVFTALVLLIVAVFPTLLSHIPQYGLGIIMVYSGWKMIANIAHVRAEGRYALIMAGICGLLVFKLGIFEGLLILLAGHAIIQFIFMKRLGKSNAEIVAQFKMAFVEHPEKHHIEHVDILSEPVIPVLNKWLRAMNNHDLDALMKLYHTDSLMIPIFSEKIRTNIDEIKEGYQNLLEKEDVHVELQEVQTQKTGGIKIDSGKYIIQWSEKGFLRQFEARFSFVIKNGKILANHSSLVSTDLISSYLNDYDYVD